MEETSHMQLILLFSSGYVGILITEYDRITNQRIKLDAILLVNLLGFFNVSQSLNTNDSCKDIYIQEPIQLHHSVAINH